jgi:hypothetical protein
MSKNKFAQKDGSWIFMFSENEGFAYYIPSLNFIMLEFLKHYNSKGANHYRDMVVQKMNRIIKQ